MAPTNPGPGEIRRVLGPDSSMDPAANCANRNSFDCVKPVAFWNVAVYRTLYRTRVGNYMGNYKRMPVAFLILFSYRGNGPFRTTHSSPGGRRDTAPAPQRK